MKKIYCCKIEMNYNSMIYEVQLERSECEYSEKWFEDEEDPIKEYVQNMYENADIDFEDGYTWDDDKGNISFSTLTMEEAYHILFKAGEPIEIYFVAEEE